MSKMKDRALIDLVRDAAIPHLKDIGDFYSREGEKFLEEEIAAGDWPELEGVPLGPLDPESEAIIAAVIWNASLTDICQSLLRTIVEQSTQPSHLVVSAASVAAACSAIDDAELRGHTGLQPEHVRPVLEKVGEALIEVVRAHCPIETVINRQPVSLWPQVSP